MSDFITFAKRVQDVLHDAYRTRHWTSEEAEKYMANYGARRQRFEKLAEHLNLIVIRPRQEITASHFANANMQREERPNRTSCWLEFCQRFPTFAELEFSVEHDARFEKLIIHTRTYMMPVFVRFTEQDNLVLSLDGVDENTVADWVEERLLEFLDNYLRIDGGGDVFVDVAASDPVCGMQIPQSIAAASESYYGHPFYFCSVECLAKFQQDPEQYAQVKTL